MRVPRTSHNWSVLYREWYIQQKGGWQTPGFPSGREISLRDNAFRPSPGRQD